MNDSRPDVLIIGGGIGGLTLALSLHQAGVSCRVLESAPEIRPLGVGINLLPHAMRELSELGLQDRLAARAIETRTLAYYSRHGQPIISDTRGRYAGYDWPQLSIHRADLHDVLLEAARARLGDDAVQLDRRCTRIDQDGSGVTVHFDNAAPLAGKVAIGCDGIHSAVRRQLFPDEGPPKYSGVNMWRGAVRWPAFLGGNTMISTGWAAHRARALMVSAVVPTSSLHRGMRKVKYWPRLPMLVEPAARAAAVFSTAAGVPMTKSPKCGATEIGRAHV